MRRKRWFLCSAAIITFTLIHRDASEMFLSRLTGIIDPEEKRKIMGASFIEVFDEEAVKINGPIFSPRNALPRCD